MRAIDDPVILERAARIFRRARDRRLLREALEAEQTEAAKDQPSKAIRSPRKTDAGAGGPDAAA